MARIDETYLFTDSVDLVEPTECVADRPGRESCFLNKPFLREWSFVLKNHEHELRARREIGEGVFIRIIHRVSHRPARG